MKLAQEVSHHASGLTYSSAAMTVIGGLTLNEWLAISGIVLGLATFVVNWVYKQKHWKRLREKDG
jgi:hypothetical protein